MGIQDLLEVFDCEECRARALSTHLRGACASVGIERDLTTEQVMAAYLVEFHRRGHTAPPV